MTDREIDVKSAEFNLLNSKLNVRIAKVEMEQGYIRLKAKFDAQYESLKAEHERAVLDLQEAELQLKVAKERVDKAFE
jgi:ribosomal protein S8